MKTKIFKFGGSSIRTPKRIENSIQIIREAQKNHQIRGVVFSALGGITDQLIAISHQAAKNNSQYKLTCKEIEARHYKVIDEMLKSDSQTHVREHVQFIFNELKDILHGVYLVKELSPKALDFIMGFGERLSAYIISEILNDAGIASEFLDTRQIIQTDDHFGSACVDWVHSRKSIISHFESQQKLQIITGFIASTPQGETTTLGRGGSDYTAALIGAALKVDEIEIWTDVDGVLTANPTKVKKAFSIDSLTYEEAMEMSHFGARVIYPPTIQPAAKQHIPIRIRNTMNPGFAGTVIARESDSKMTVKGISSIDNIALIRLQGSGLIGVAGIARRLFGALSEKQISVIMISQASSEHSICFAVTPDTSALARQTIHQEFELEINAGQVEGVFVENDLSIVAIVGENMRHATGIAGRCFGALGKNGINIAAIAQGSSELNISVVVDKENEAKALNALHEGFFLSDTKTLNLFLLGTGTIGGTLIEQVKCQSPSLRSNCGLDLKVAGIGNVDGMLFDENGIPLDNWETSLSAKGEPVDLDNYVSAMTMMNLPNSIFIDCTGIYEIVDHYESILNHSISIVTPNKIANSGPFEQYDRLKRAAFKHGVKFLYETNVGAGLPVISTLNDLLSSGDTILKIEAVLSGTLSYIFNTVDKSKPFSQVVKQAQEQGLSEPDPRDDLSGLDVARKLLILAREIGHHLEPDDIQLEPLLPESCIKAPSVNAFYSELEKWDSEFEERRSLNEAENKLLRYMAVLENGKAMVTLKAVDQSHPFHTLSGSDNMIVFTTERYCDRPLVVKGPGAGAEVTAAGVFADVIRIANYLK